MSATNASVTRRLRGKGGRIAPSADPPYAGLHGLGLANPDMRKLEIIVLIVLFSAFAYLGIQEEGRGGLKAFAIMAVLAALVYGSVLQERAYRKAHRPGASIFSIPTMLRVLATREMLYFGLLMLGLVTFVGFIVAVDEAGYFGRP